MTQYNFSKLSGQEEQLLKLLTRRDCPREDRKTVVKRDVIRVMLELPGREVEKEMLTEDEEVIHICSSGSKYI